MLEALLSHPDEAKWGRVLGRTGAAPGHCHGRCDPSRGIVDASIHFCRESSPCEELDLRFLVVELCQPLEHLKGEYERVLCTRSRGRVARRSHSIIIS